MPDRAAHADLAAAIKAGDRRALARGITLVESTRADHREAAEALLAELLPASGGAIRLGVSGSPGVGKSTFIETFGLHVVSEGHRLAVLAVDPSSNRGGGSILGDKTRMPELSRHAQAFIRPSPAGRTLGGVARRTREAMLLTEAAGFDVVLVETVGVGQSETAVAEMTDMFLLLLPPAGGDELQGLKRGIVELADLVLVNKADGDLKPAAMRAVSEYTAALNLLKPASPHWRPEVRPISALEGAGIPETWAAVQRFRAAMDGAGALAERRAAQAKAAFRRELNEGFLEAVRDRPDLAERLAALENEVEAGRTSPTAAARRLLGTVLDGGAGMA